MIPAKDKDPQRQCNGKGKDCQDHAKDAPVGGKNDGSESDDCRDGVQDRNCLFLAETHIQKTVVEMPAVRMEGALSFHQPADKSKCRVRQRNGKSEDDDQDSISNDLEIIQSEGVQALRQVDPKMVEVKSMEDDEMDAEVQKGWQGHVLPFGLVQQYILTDEYKKLQQTREALVANDQAIAQTLESFTEDEDLGEFLTEANDGFDMDKIGEVLTAALSQVSTPEINGLKAYLDLLAAKVKKPVKMTFINSHKEIDWSAIESSKDGTYSKSNVQKRVNALLSDYVFDEETTEAQLQNVVRLVQNGKDLKRSISTQEKDLDEKAHLAIPKLTDEEVRMLLRKKWIEPLCDALNLLSTGIINDLTNRLLALVQKYDDGLVDVEKQIDEAGAKLAERIPQLKGNDADNKALAELFNLMSPL